MKISQAEFEVLLALWDCEEPTRPAKLLQRMEATHPWSISTLKTLLTRLQDKGAVQVICQKRFHYCTPTYTKEEFFSLQTKRLMRSLKTSPASLLGGLISDGELTEEELDGLEQMLAAAKSRELSK